MDHKIYSKYPNEFNHNVNIILNECNHHFYHSAYNGPKIGYLVWESTRMDENFFKLYGNKDQLYTLIMGDPNDDSKKGLVGHLAYIVGSFAGLTGESGWKAIADSVKALGRLIFGGEKSTTYGKSGEDTSLLGRIFSLSNVNKTLALGLALSWLIPFLGPVAGISIAALAVAFGFDKRCLPTWDKV